VNRQVGRRGGGGALGTQHRTSVLFSNFNSHWYCEYAPNGVNVCERDITLPGRSEVRLAATTPCRQQLCTVSASNVVSAALLSPPATPSWWASLTVGSL